jgi:Secretion system C-terminal sorting domain/PA14 domain
MRRFIFASGVLTIFLSSISEAVYAQCGTAGDQVTYGSNSWIGYVYNGQNNFTTGYQGFITETQNFDEGFNGDFGPFAVNTACSVTSTDFSVRFKMQLNLACGTYQFTVGADDGVRFSTDGGSTFLINDYSDHGYRTTTTTAYLTGGTYNFIVEYYENTGNNRVTFAYSFISNSTGGVVGSDQTVCGSPTIDPAAFTSASPALFCTGNPLTYQWQSSPDNSTWSAISGQTSATYDIPSGFPAGTQYFRRRATDNITADVVYSNTVTVLGQTAAGDQITYGSGATPWIGYVYDGVDNFSTNYLGFITEPIATSFDESFTCDACTISLNGCNLFTETFTVRFKSQQTLPCGNYQFTVGGDDGVRLSIDGGSTFLINDYSVHGYRTATATTYLTGGTYNFVLEYYEDGGGNRVSFTSSLVSDGIGGQIGSSQTLCNSGAIDPAAFTNITSAAFCTGVLTYQWQDSPDNSTFTNISGANSSTFDIPSGFPAPATRYYRRSATNGVTTEYSNTATIISTTVSGDEVTYGNGSWIGYAYDGVNNYSSPSYQGSFTESAIFDESFCGDNCDFTIAGCPLNTQTFTVRFKMRITLANAGYTFTIGADDGVRLSIDGGSTYLLSDYSDHGYRTVSSGVTNLNGTYDLVLEFYENSGGNRVSFSYVAGALPVTLSEFKGRQVGDYNMLEWTTASEKNNQGFYIERSLDARKFESIGWIPGNGTTLVKQSYSFKDELPQIGINYYRLNQQDFDLKQEYSNVISVASSGEPQFNLYPNPSKGDITIAYSTQQDETAYLKIIDTIRGGDTNFSATQSQGKFHLSNLPSGIYLAWITVGKNSVKKKFIVLE